MGQLTFSQRMELNKEAASHCPEEERGVKRGHEKERLHSPVCVRRLGIVIHYVRENTQKDTASWRNIGSKEIGRESYAMRHCTGEGRNTWMGRNDP